MTDFSMYEITERFREMEAAIIDAGGVITDEIDEEYDDLLDAAEDKTESYIAVIQEKTEMAKAVKAEERRLKKRRKALENTADRLKERLLDSMKIMGQDTRETTLGKVRVQKASRRGVTVHTDDMEHVPYPFKKVSVRADKTAIYEAMQDGEVEELTNHQGEVFATMDPASEYIRIY